jgi:hypothetical protein
VAELDGALLVVHPERKDQRVLGRILGATGRRVVVVSGLADAVAALRDGTPAVIVIDSGCRLARGGDDLVDRALAAGCRGCVIVHPERMPVPGAVFEASSCLHLVTSSMPVLAEELFLTVQRLLRGAGGGLERYLQWGAFVDETEVISTDDRLRVVAELGEQLEAMDIGRRQQAAIALAADELILNAVHHAPVDERGERYLLELARDATRDLLGRERPKVRWGCDGRWFAIAVRDAYGSLDAATIVRYVAKSFVRRGQVRAEGPGAGIGLAMTFQAVTQLVFDVTPGRCTEAIALVDVRPWPPSTLPLCASFHAFFADA